MFLFFAFWRSLFFNIRVATLGHKYRDRRGEESDVGDVGCEDSRVVFARSTAVVTVWHEGAGCRLSRSFTCHTAHTSANVAVVRSNARVVHSCTRLADAGRARTSTLAYGAVGRSYFTSSRVSSAALLPRESHGRGRWRRSSGCVSRTRRRRRISPYVETFPSRRNRKRKDPRLGLGS